MRDDDEKNYVIILIVLVGLVTYFPVHAEVVTSRQRGIDTIILILLTGNT